MATYCYSLFLLRPPPQTAAEVKFNLVRLFLFLASLGCSRSRLRTQNVVDYLALTTSGFLKKLQYYYYQRLDGSHGTIEEKEKEESSCWQEPPEDVKELIVKHLTVSSRVRLSSSCKSWRLVCMRREIQTCPQLPWLVHPQLKTGDSLSFSSLSEGKVFKSTCVVSSDFKSRLNRLVGRTNKTSSFLDSSRGWLVMVDWELYYYRSIRVLYLVNPISGAQHRLPPLPPISGYKLNYVDPPLGQVVLSSPDISKTMVAATVDIRKLLLCRPRDKGWSVFEVLDENDIEGCVARILFSSTGILYALVKESSDCGGETWIANRTLKFGDDEVKLKVIYGQLGLEWWIDEGFSMREFAGLLHGLNLAESTSNELLLIYQFVGTDVGEDVMEGNGVAEEGNNYNGEGDEVNNMDGNVQNNESILRRLVHILRNALKHLKSFIHDEKPEILDLRTRCFRVYKIDPENNTFRRVQDLGDQILFLADDGSSLSLLASEFKELRGNCIYFATKGMSTHGNIIHTSREIGIFYLDSGKIERPFPSFEMANASRLSWLMPSLW